ncbi:MAG TPA: DUF1538 domain-containing protein [Firmicutes bacterium]|nr:DUF1538 domain-containing protein [Bacillota bacterium]
MTLLLKKLKEISFAVLPITILVLILNFTIVPIEFEMLARFLLGALLVVLGLGIFLFGAHIGVSPLGTLIGESIAKTNKIYAVAALGFLMGFLITIAEPDLQILAGQVNQASGGIVSAGLVLIVVSIGVGIMVAIGLLRILFGTPLNRIFTITYLVIFFLGLKASAEFLAISVDASGATTGAMTTPFILALGYGVSRLKGGEKTEEDSFGLVGQASAGPIFAIMLMSIVKRLSHIQGEVEPFLGHSGILAPYAEVFPVILKESFLTLFPLVILFIVFDLTKFKLNKKSRNSIFKGLLYTFLGLTLFLVGVNAGFMEVGRVMGEGIAHYHGCLLPVLGFFLGMVVVLAEPAVYVLTEQVEEVTAGHIKRKLILVVLSLGIAIAVSLSMLRILFSAVKLWHFLLPGFALAAFLSYRVPPIFVGIAYDSGGVASGPMTATFVLAFAQGAANAVPSANVLVDGFGVIAMVAMTPLVAVQILGMVFKAKEKKQRLLAERELLQRRDI